MPISLDEVHRLAADARLALRPDEAEAMRAELDGMLAGIEALPPADGEPRAPIPGLESARLRDDVGTPDMLLLPPSAMAPAWAEGMFVVPRLAWHGGAAPPAPASDARVSMRTTGTPGRAGERP